MSELSDVVEAINAGIWFDQGFPAAEVDAATTSLTSETLDRLWHELWDAPIRVCGVTEPHVVGPRSEGWTRCGNCGWPVKVRDVDGRKYVESS